MLLDHVLNVSDRRVTLVWAAASLPVASTATPSRCTRRVLRPVVERCCVHSSGGVVVGVGGRARMVACNIRNRDLCGHNGAVV